MNLNLLSLEKHAEWRGKIRIGCNAEIRNNSELAVAYTPGVAAPCLEIQKNPELSFKYTGRGKFIAVVTDGSAVLGLGNIGSLAAMPVMEGKCALFKSFGGVDAFPICISSDSPEETVDTILKIAGSFGGINLEDIAAPNCFYIEKRLRELLDIPVLHDDRHGTAVCTAAAVINSLKITEKDIKSVKCVISGAGAAGSEICRCLLELGMNNIVVCNSKGAVYRGKEGLNQQQSELAELTNPCMEKGSLSSVLKNADIFIGVSAPDILSERDISAMNKNAVVLALANPVPEISPEAAYAGGATIVATGRSDYPNQINNVLAFPGIFRGALDSGAKEINRKMIFSAIEALAGLVSEEELLNGRIIPDPFDPRVAPAVATAVARAAVESGVVREIVK